MIRKQILKNLHPVLTFDVVGENKILTVKEVRKNVQTQFGSCDMIDFIDCCGEVQSIFMGAALKLFDWNLLTGVTIELVYQGKVKNKATKRQYDDYEIYVMEEETIKEVQKDKTEEPAEEVKQANSTSNRKFKGQAVVTPEEPAK